MKIFQLATHLLTLTFPLAVILCLVRSLRSRVYVLRTTALAHPKNAPSRASKLTSFRTLLTPCDVRTNAIHAPRASERNRAPREERNEPSLRRRAPRDAQAEKWLFFSAREVA